MLPSIDCFFWPFSLKFCSCSYTFGIEKSETEENQEENAALKGFTHVLEPGVTKEPFYGIRLAKSMDMPPEIVQRAEVIADQLKQTQSQVNSIQSVR